MNKKAVILSVAGSDSSGGAGIQADLKTISALGGYAATAITGITVQNTLGVSDIHWIPAQTVGRQMKAVIEDLKPDSLKIGMIGGVDTVMEISRVLHHFRPKTVVFDPVMISTSRHSLMPEHTLESIREHLLPEVSLVTPNLYEASVLLERKVSTIDDMKEGCRQLFDRHGCAFLLKGGHLEGDDMCDVLYDGSEFYLFHNQRVKSRNLHGTGCTLSSAIATYLAQGESLPHAVRLAKDYVWGAIDAGKELQIGSGNGPLWHFSKHMS